MTDAMMLVTLAFAAVDAALSAGLLLVYARSYRRVRAPFTLGLMLFALFFLLQNLLAVYAYFTMMGFVDEHLQPYMAAIMGLEAAALGLMLYASNK
jgi:hypothetical protein